MTRLAIWSLLASLLCGCPGGRVDKDTSAGDTAGVGLDVSGLLCAGLEDLDGDTLVPTTVNGVCDGGNISGQLSCIDCSFWHGHASIWIGAIWHHSDGSQFLRCGEVDVLSDGSFAFEQTAPFVEYTLDFTGRVQSGQLGSLHEFEPFEVCSDDVWIDAEVEEVTDAG